MTTANHAFHSDFARKYFAEGEAEMLLKVLAFRGLEVGEDVRARILGCGDTGQLETWAKRALTAKSLDEVFSD